MAFATARVKTYTVHVHPQKRPLAEHAQFVPEGFNVWAFAFGWLWAASQRMWWVAFGLLGVLLAVQLLHAYGLISGAEMRIFQAGFALWVGCEANDWRRACVAKAGWVMMDIVAEDSLLHAQQRFFARHASLLHTTPSVAMEAAAPAPRTPWSAA